MDFIPGAEFGGYRLIERLGAGGMGEVWKAQDLRLDRIVAIKILARHMADDAESRARLEREARAAARLYHPNIATIHSLDQIDGQSYIVMEYVEGVPLSRAIAAGPLPDGEVCRIGRAVAAALAEAHRHGIIHRDIKPDNIVLSDGKVKVLDFGIAKRVVTDAVEKPLTVLTEAGMILGTVQYMSPEQALGRQLDPRTDIFSLGVVLFQALTGQLPFSGSSVTDVLTQVIRDDAPDVAAVKPSISPSLAAIVRRCLARDRDHRFASAEELVSRFELIASAPTVASTTDRMATIPPTEQLPAAVNRRPLMFAIAAVVLVAVVAGGAAVWLRSTPGVIADEPQAQTPSTQTVAPAATTIEVTPSLATNVAAVPPPAAAPVSKVEPAQPPPTDVKPEPVAKATHDPSPSAAALAKPHHEEGMRLLQARHVRASLVHFHAALLADPHFAPSRLRIAAAMVGNRRMEQARIEFEKTLADRERLDAREQKLADIGMAASRGEREEAEALALAFEEQYPGDPELAMLREAAEGGEGGKRPLPGRRLPRRR
jgi:serine/threonine protein kinase